MKRLIPFVLVLTATILWAATETLVPTGKTVEGGTAWVEAVTVVDEGTGSPDGSTLCPSNDTTNAVRLSFDTPTGDPTTGTNDQQFKFYMVKCRNNCIADASNANPTYDAWANDGASTVEQVANDVAVTTEGELDPYNWTYSGFASADGSNVEVRFLNNGNGAGGGSQRGTCVDAVDWVVSYTAAAGGRRTGIVVGKIIRDDEYPAP